MIGQALLNLETRGARLAAALDARPDLGALWRRMVALTEASASLSLENIHVPEADLMRPRLGLGQIKGEPQSTQTAQALYRAMLRPGSITQDPAGVLDRCIAAARMADLVDHDEGGRVAYPDSYEQDGWDAGREAFIAAVGRVAESPAPVTLRALALAQVALEVLPERQPMAERLIFMAAESDLRRDVALADPVISQDLEGVDLDTRVDASWVYLPSLSLTRGGFRAWSPVSRNGWEVLFERLHDTLAREAGRLGQINAWSNRLESALQGQRKSPRSGLAKLLRQTPILNAASTAAGLGMSERRARSLLEEAQEMQVLACLTPRSSYRLWAVPVLAEMIEERGGRSGMPVRRTLEEEEAARDASTGGRLRRDDPDFDARIANALSELDAALRGIDAVVEKYRTSRPGR